MIRRIDHIGIAVTRLDEAVRLYEQALGLKCERVEEVAGQQVRVAFFDVGGTRLELLEPTSADSPVGRFLADRGEGVHHVAFATDDLAAQLAQAQGAGVRPVDAAPAVGAGGRPVAFLHPKSTRGVLTELCSDERH